MKQFLRTTRRYAHVGLFCAVLNNIVVIVMDRLGYHYVLAVASAFLLTTSIGYLLHAIYTFEVAASRSGGLRFMGASLSAFPLSMGAMFVLCGGMGFAAWVAMPIATILLFAWNYLLAHLMIARPAGGRT